MRSTSPAIQPSPSVTSYSRPRSARSCMPTQMPKNGRPFFSTASSIASTMPSTASSPRRQSAKAPTPGSTTRSARCHRARIVGYDNRLIEADVMRGALERLGRRVQVAGAVINDRHGHLAAPGSGNRPMMSGAGDVCGVGDGGAAGGPGGEAVGPGRGSEARRSQASKKRRSASSRLSPLTTPIFFQPRRASLKRRKVAASMPTNSAIRNPIKPSSGLETPR